MCSDGKLTGFDIDFIQTLSEKLKVEPSAMNMEFKGLIPALQGGRIDIINSAMYIQPDPLPSRSISCPT